MSYRIYDIEDDINNVSKELFNYFLNRIKGLGIRITIIHKQDELDRYEIHYDNFIDNSFCVIVEYNTNTVSIERKEKLLKLKKYYEKNQN